MNRTSNIRVVLSYDGTGFCGWQLQKNDRTVQGEVEKALHAMHGRRIPVTAAGRTDSGVHASAQTINFTTDITSIQADKFYIALNANLPKDVRALKSDEVPSRFHSRYDAISRTYRYFLLTSPVCPPWYRNYCYPVMRPLDIQLLNSYASFLPGEHDFTTFAVPGDKSKSRIRRIQEAFFYVHGQYIAFTITGNAFLWRMVRSLVGTMLDLEKLKEPAQRFKEVLDRQERSLAGKTAPGRGLFLHKVEYNATNF